MAHCWIGRLRASHTLRIEEKKKKMENDNEVKNELADRARDNDKGALSIMAALMVVAIVAAFYFATHQPKPEACVGENDVRLAQAQAAKAQAEFATACLKKDSELRLAVEKSCAEAGNIPVFIGGNLDCKPAPAKGR